MGILIIFGILFIIFAIIIGSVDKAHDDEIKLKKEQGIEYEGDVIHLAGHPYFKENQKVKFKVEKGTIILNPYLSGSTRVVHPEQIVRCEVKTEREISKDITFTRLVALGIFAFAFKKKTITEEQFLVLSYTENNIQLDCIFKNGHDTSNLTYKHCTLVNLVNAVNRIRIENNQSQNSVGLTTN